MSNRYAPSRRALRCAAALGLCLPAALAAQQRHNGLLVGRVLSGDVAVPSAAIIVSGGRVTLARVDGRFRMSLPAGRYEVRAQRIGYASGRDSVTIVAGDSAVVTFKVDRALSSLEQVAWLGTRGFERAVADAPAPVDVIDGVQLRSTGRTSTADALLAFAPSLNRSHAGAEQGSDLVHAITMRGLDPDEVLVLVNGKRRHSSAQVNINGSLGRGASGVDLDAIPASLVDHVEILHGDATAQYGSDAIAGVVNIVLKSGVHGVAESMAGSRLTTVNVGDGSAAQPFGNATHDASDGRTFAASIDKGVVFGERGFLHGGLELRDRGATNRTVAGPFNLGAAQNGYGDAYAHDVALLFNGGNLFRSGVELYGNAGGSHRVVNAEYPVSSLGTTPVSPVVSAADGDYAGTLGLRGHLDDWRYDVSTVLGWNAVDLSLAPAYNVLLVGGGTRASLDAGSQRFAQSTTNVELFRTLPFFDELRFTLGGELRHESYRVKAGEPASDQTPADATEIAPYWLGLAAFSPSQATDAARTALAAHVDLEADVNDALVIGLAGRVEHYGDVGTQLAGKLSMRLEPVRNVALRGSVARGFHAPTLQQASLSITDTAVTFPTGQILPVSSPLLTGVVPALRAERSTDYSVGLVAALTSALSFSADLYRTDLKDRLVISDGTLVSGGGYIAWVTNGVDTRTTGLDATASYGVKFDSAGTLRLTAGANVNHLSVQRNEALSRASLTRFVDGQPRDNVFASAQLALGAAAAMLRVQSFGSVTVEGISVLPPSGGISGVGYLEGTLGRRTVTDASVSYTLRRKYTVTAGADNLFDAYPSRAAVSTSTFDLASPYRTESPFGFNGRFVYGKLSIYL